MDATSRTGNIPKPQAHPPIDGKVFFKNVKARLSEENFNEFLLNIKRLNGKI